MTQTEVTQGNKKDAKLVCELLSDVEFEVVGDASTKVTGITSASNKVASGDLFFCIVGFKSDGHKYAKDAVARGCCALVVQHKLDIDVPQFIVENTRIAMALASARFYDMPSTKMQVMGVTGTNGKTTTAYLTDWIANYIGYRTGVIGTVETRIANERIHADHTTPESIDLQRLLNRMIEAKCDLVSMEVSSHAIDLYRVLGTKFAVVGFSNLTQDHLDYHNTMQNYFEAKAALFDTTYAQKAAICIDNEYGERLVKIAKGNGLDVVSVGFSQKADIHILSVDYQTTHTTIEIDLLGEVFKFDYPLIGHFNVENVLLTIGLAHQLGYKDQKICKALQSAPQVPGRLERVAAPRLTPRQTHDKLGFSVFVDYAHTPDAICNAIGALKPITKGNLIIVFGCGGDRDKTKRPKMGNAACEADQIVVTSDNPRTEDPMQIIEDILPGMDKGEGRYSVIADRGQAIAYACRQARPGDNVLIAGKGHEDYQLVGDKVLDFDDRVVASQELEQLVEGELA